MPSSRACASLCFLLAQSALGDDIACTAGSCSVEEASMVQTLSKKDKNVHRWDIETLDKAFWTNESIGHQLETALWGSGNISRLTSGPPESCQSGQQVAANHDLHGVVIVMTGGYEGIGLEVTRALAKTNATIVLAAHNPTHAKKDTANISGDIDIPSVGIDLGSFESIRTFAQAVLLKHARIDMLINDAGIVHPYGNQTTKDSFETVFETDYLGPFLLTELLLPKLRESPVAKVINVGSMSAWLACLASGRLPACLRQSNWEGIARNPPPLAKWEAHMFGTTWDPNYGVAKFFSIAHAYELTRLEQAKGSPVRAYSMRPGVVNTKAIKGITELECAGTCALGMHRICHLPADGNCPIYPSEASATTVFLAVTPKKELENTLLPKGDTRVFYECYAAWRPEAIGWSWDTDPKELYDASLKWAGVGSEDE